MLRATLLHTGWLAAALSAQVQIPIWHPLSSGTMHTLNSVFFTGMNTGFAVGTGGTILKTTDGGFNWALQHSDTGYALRSVQFPTRDTGYAVGGKVTYSLGWPSASNVILKTVDGGANWVRQNSLAASYMLHSISCVSSQICWTAGGNGSGGLIPVGGVLKTVDGGANWTRLPIGEGWSFVHFPTASVGFGLRFSDYMVPIVKTVDGGNTWSNLTTAGMQSLHFPNVNTGYCVGRNNFGFAISRIIKTINGGTNWTTQDSSVLGLNSVFAFSANVAWTVGDSGTIRNTVNGGTTWTAQSSGTRANLLSVHFPTANTGYAVGANGVILKFGVPLGLSRKSAKTIRFAMRNSGMSMLFFDARGRLMLRQFSR